MTKIGWRMGLNRLYNPRRTFEEGFPHQTSHSSLELKRYNWSICHTLNPTIVGKSYLKYELHVSNIIKARINWVTWIHNYALIIDKCRFLLFCLSLKPLIWLHNIQVFLSPESVTSDEKIFKDAFWRKIIWQARNI